jgi:transposase
MMKWNRLRAPDRPSGEALAPAAHQENEARVSRRILAIRHLLEGHGADETAGLFALGRTQLYAWTHRYNAEELAGLSDGPHPGGAEALACGRRSSFPIARDCRAAGRVGIIGVPGEDARQLLRDEFDAGYSLPGVYSLLHRLRLSNLAPRPRIRIATRQRRWRLKNELPDKLTDLQRAHPDKQRQWWFQDEARFGQQGSNSRVRAAKDGRPRAAVNGVQIILLFGAICPATGETNAWMMPAANTKAMNI